MEIINLEIPLNENKIRNLNVRDTVEISGIIYTARDKAHKFIFDNINNEIKPQLNNTVIYHCGPLVKKNENSFEIISAGPTTSYRMSLYLPKIVEKFNIKAILGKGGLDSSMLKVFNKIGCVYLSIIGGLGALCAQKIKEVKEVYYLNEFGSTEAMWKLEVEKMPAIVTMDTKFNSLHDDILNQSLKISKELNS